MDFDATFRADVTDDRALDDNFADVDFGFHDRAFTNDQNVIGKNFAFEAAIDAHGAFEGQLAFERGAAAQKRCDFTHWIYPGCRLHELVIITGRLCEARIPGRVPAMQRHILASDRIHPAAQAIIASNHSDIVEEVQAAIAANAVVIVGMKQNPVPKKARKTLDARGTAYKYLEYGSYLNTWRRRNALKMWSGWPTFPMIFVKGTLIGGCEDMEKLIASGEFDRMMAA